MWITIDDLGSTLEPHVLAEVGLRVLRDRGVDAVVDGLDEPAPIGNCADASGCGVCEGVAAVAGAPDHSRSPGLVAEELLVAAPMLARQEAAALAERCCGSSHA